MGEQGRNGTEDDGEIYGTWERGTEQNITTEEGLDSGVAGKGIFGRMNLDFLFGEGDEVIEEGEETDDQMEEEAEEEGIDDGSTCCPAPSNPCEVIFASF